MDNSVLELIREAEETIEDTKKWIENDYSRANKLKNEIVSGDFEHFHINPDNKYNHKIAG